MPTLAVGLAVLCTVGALVASSPSSSVHSLWPEADVIVTYYVYVPGDTATLDVDTASLWDWVYAPSKRPGDRATPQYYVFNSDPPLQHPPGTSDLPYAPSFKHPSPLFTSENSPLFRRPVDPAPASPDFGALQDSPDRLHTSSFSPLPTSPPYETRRPFIPSSTPVDLASVSPNIVRGEGLEKTVPGRFQDNAKPPILDRKSVGPSFDSTRPFLVPPSTISSLNTVEGSFSSRPNVLQDRILSSLIPQSTPPPISTHKTLITSEDFHRNLPNTVAEEIPSPSPPLISTTSTGPDVTPGPLDPSRSLFTATPFPEDAHSSSRSPLFSPYAYPTQVPPRVVPKQPLGYDAPGHEHPKR